ncbi:MAG: hypothetical protein ACC628_18670, partial [Pirellulaceae bacterium]
MMQLVQLFFDFFQSTYELRQWPWVERDELARHIFGFLFTQHDDVCVSVIAGHFSPGVPAALRVRPCGGKSLH